MSPEPSPVLPPNEKNRTDTGISRSESAHKKKKNKKNKKDKKRKRNARRAENEEHHSNDDGTKNKKQRTHDPVESLDTEVDTEEAMKEAALEEELKKLEKEKKNAEKEMRRGERKKQLGSQAPPHGITAPSPAVVIYTVSDIAKPGQKLKPVGETRILPGMDGNATQVKETRIVPGMNTTPAATSKPKVNRAKDPSLSTKAKTSHTVSKMSTMKLDPLDSDSEDGAKEVVAIKKIEWPQKTASKSNNSHMSDPFAEAGSSTTPLELEEEETPSHVVRDITNAPNSEIKPLFYKEPITLIRRSNGSNGTHRRRSITINDNTNGSVESETKKYEEVPDIWQEGPGKVRGRVDAGGDAETEEVIAFSSQHLHSRPNGVTVSGIRFSVLGFDSNHKKTLSDQGNKDIMICSVARGTVEVMLCGKVFRVGAGGMWRIREGEKCVGKKFGGEAAVVHVTKLAVE